MSLSLRLNDWPETDRAMWSALIAKGNPLDEEGRFAHLREASRTKLLAGYGRWLAWLMDADPAALAESPADRCTLERLLRWRATMEAMRPMSRLSLIDDTLKIVMAAAPDATWTRHLRLRKQLKRDAGNGDQSRKSGRVLSSAVLFEAGKRHATVDVLAATTVREAMKRQRNGTIVAMLALMPIRRRAFAQLAIGTSLIVDNERISVVLSGDLTKTGVPWEAEVPAPASVLLRQYLTATRPWFLASGNQRHDLLWVGDHGEPFQVGHFGNKIACLTTKLTGVRVSPHLFRDSAATTLSRISSDAARLIRPVLAHQGFGTAERHYIHAETIDAGRDYARLINRLKRSR